MRMVGFLYDRLRGRAARPRLVEMRHLGRRTLLARTRRTCALLHGALLIRTRLAWTLLTWTMTLSFTWPFTWSFTWAPLGGMPLT